MKNTISRDLYDRLRGAHNVPARLWLVSDEGKQMMERPALFMVRQAPRRVVLYAAKLLMPGYLRSGVQGWGAEIAGEWIDVPLKSTLVMPEGNRLYRFEPKFRFCFNPLRLTIADDGESEAAELAVAATYER